MTNKNVPDRAAHLRKVQEGRTTVLWDVFLGDIGVVSTKDGMMRILAILFWLVFSTRVVAQTAETNSTGCVRTVR
ncbi:MAG: hypothetical protein IPI07_11095 [Flavobacteriales bacterium]|nr:hypothetical protein [Flavobacteriales bacterium]